MIRNSIPKLPKLHHSIDDLRVRFADNPLVLHLVDVIEAYQKREAYVQEVGEALHTGAQGQEEVSALMVAMIGEGLAMAMHEGKQ